MVKPRQPSTRDASTAKVLAAQGVSGASISWFDPANPALAATPVDAGGRGSAWFVRGPFGDGVLRHYRRGGAVAKISQDQYVWSGEAQVRSVAELRLMEALCALGLPVPAPIAAAYWRNGLTYRAAILVTRIPAARTLASQVVSGEDAQALWHATGAMLARFHAAGLDHADMNAHNLLFDGAGQPWLIDFDRSALRPTADARVGVANMARLQRSLDKIGALPGSCGDAQRIGSAIQAGYVEAQGSNGDVSP